MNFNSSQQYILDRIIVNETTGCWEWKLSTSHHGYGQCFHPIENKVKRAHRVSYELFIGTIPPGVLVLHKCDNRKCVNPEHLFLGTSQSNTDDMMQKGRDKFPKPGSKPPGSFKVGVDHAKSKLTEEQVLEIRRRAIRGNRYYTGNKRELAKEFGVAYTTITAIVRGICWNHI
jgi:hypothetical protein